MTEEIWKPILGFEGYYEVSNLGRVRSVDRYNSRGRFCSSRFISPGLAGRGYFQIHLYKDNKSYNRYVHRVVAEAFIPNPKNLEQVNHIDGNKLNNHVSNLEWCTNTENNQKAWDMGLHKAPNIVCLETGVVFKTAKDAAVFAGVCSSRVTHVCLRMRGAKSAGGYHFEYVDKN